MTVAPCLAVRALVVAAAVASVAPAAAQPASTATSAPNAGIVNRGVVELVTGPSGDNSVRMAEEIAAVVDDGATRRVVPVVGKGPLQNLTDLRYLRGIDLAIVPTDVLDHARDQRSLAGLGSSLTYIAKLYNLEFHLLSRSDVTKIADLSGRTVNVDLQGSGTAFTTGRLFDLLNIKARLANDNQQVALEKLRRGEIAAVAFVAPKPAPFLNGVKADGGLHLLSIPLTRAITAAYAPTRITSTDYPDFLAADQSADTIAVGSVLLAADLRNFSERYRNVSNFVDALFTNFQGLLAPGRHPKWQEVNIGAELAGWTRHPAAQQWLQRNAPVAVAANPESLETLFSRFIDERRQATGAPPMSAGEKDVLFKQFQSWQRGQAR